jgi:transposase-like protein
MVLPLRQKQQLHRRLLVGESATDLNDLAQRPLGCEKHDPAGHHRGNTRNGKNQKTLKGDFGELELETSRDRQTTFEPKIVAKGQTRWKGFDDKIISMYARGIPVGSYLLSFAGVCDRVIITR